LLGANDEEMADIFGVAVGTLNEWKTEHPEFGEALRNGKTKADAEIAHSLYHRAKGYAHSAVKIHFTRAGEPIYAPYTERFPPDTGAATLWLSNRRRKDWRSVNTIALTGGDGGPLLPPLVIINPVRAVTSEPRPVIEGEVVYENESGDGVAGHGDD